MLHDAGAKAAGVAECEAHQPCVADRALPVAEQYGARLAQQPDLRHFFTAAAAGHGAVGQDGKRAGFLAART